MKSMVSKGGLHEIALPREEIALPELVNRFGDIRAERWVDNPNDYTVTLRISFSERLDLRSGSNL